MKIALDTNRYTDAMRHDPTVIAVLSTATQVYLPAIVLGELRAGFLSGQRADENEKLLQRFLAERGVDVLSVDQQTTHHYARIRQHLRSKATPLPENDIWIAALCLQHGLTLYTRDSHFSFVPQLAKI
jgi:predicted nucleic acid-binding protein